MQVTLSVAGTLAYSALRSTLLLIYSAAGTTLLLVHCCLFCCGCCLTMQVAASLTLLVAMMKSKELKTKIHSYAHSLILTRESFTVVTLVGSPLLLTLVVWYFCLCYVHRYYKAKSTGFSFCSFPPLLVSLSC